MNYFLKKKYGENYHSKLTENELDSELLNKINNEILNFNEKESFKSNNFDMREIKNCLKSLSPKQFDFSGEYHPKKKPFSNLTKKSPDFFDSNIQYGGESEVLKPKNFLNFNSLRRNSKSPFKKSKHKLSSSINFNGNIDNSLSIDFSSNNKKENEMTSQNKEENNHFTKFKVLSLNKNLNNDFFINNEITNELLRKPIRVGVDIYEENSNKNRYNY